MLWNSLPVRLRQAQTLSSLASNPAAAVCPTIMVYYSQYTAFMESTHPSVHIIVINKLTSNSISYNFFVVRIYTQFNKDDQSYILQFSVFNLVSFVKLRPGVFNR